MSFGLFIKLLAVGFGALIVLLVFPYAKTTTDNITASWAGMGIVPPTALMSTIDILPLLLLGAILVALVWWLFGREAG